MSGVIGMGVSTVSYPTYPGYASSGTQNQKPDNKINQKNTNGANAKQDEAISKGNEMRASTNGNAVVETSPYGDTVEISKQGMGKAQSLSAPSNSTQAGQPAATGTMSEPTNSNASATYNLAHYTEYDLKKMLAEGTITRSQYNAEITRRGQAATASDTESGTEKPAVAQ